MDSVLEEYASRNDYDKTIGIFPTLLHTHPFPELDEQKYPVPRSWETLIRMLAEAHHCSNTSLLLEALDKIWLYGKQVIRFCDETYGTDGYASKFVTNFILGYACFENCSLYYKTHTIPKLTFSSPEERAIEVTKAFFGRMNPDDDSEDDSEWFNAGTIHEVISALTCRYLSSDSVEIRKPFLDLLDGDKEQKCIQQCILIDKRMNRILPEVTLEPIEQDAQKPAPPVKLLSTTKEEMLKEIETECTKYSEVLDQVEHCFEMFLGGFGKKPANKDVEEILHLTHAQVENYIKDLRKQGRLSQFPSQRKPK